MKYDSKQSLLDDSAQQWADLWKLIETIDLAKRKRKIPKDKNGICWSIPNVLSHLYAWHRLLLNWYKVGLTGTPDMPAAGYKWNQTRQLNYQFYLEYRDLTLEQVSRRVKLSHGRVMKLVQSLDESTVMQPGHLAWTGQLALSSYVGPNTASHYRWAIKKVKAIVAQWER